MMTARFRRTAGLLTLSCSLFATWTQAEEAPPAAEKAEQAASDTQFVRLDRDEDGQVVAMKTAIVKYAKPGEEGGATVDLIGAVHVGEKAYYEALNEAFTKYDAVLYELVAPKGTRIPKGAKASNSHMTGMLQNGMKGVLDLEHQLEFIDYTRENMIHADMSPEDFQKSMSDRGESMLGMAFRMMGQGIAQQSRKTARPNSDLKLLGALFSKNRELTLKRAMAEQFEDMETSMGAINGPDGSTIITERNKVALEVLKERLTAGDKMIAIFYGAGHLPDMQARLLADFGLKPVSIEWLTAWNLAEPAAAP